MLNEDGLAFLVARIEALAGRAANLQEVADRNKRNGAEMVKARAEAEREWRIRRAAEAKIGEWAKYSDRLRGLISPRRRPEIPDQPAPLESDIPF